MPKVDVQKLLDDVGASVDALVGRSQLVRRRIDLGTVPAGFDHVAPLLASINHRRASLAGTSNRLLGALSEAVKAHNSGGGRARSITALACKVLSHNEKIVETIAHAESVVAEYVLPDGEELL